MGVEIRVLPQGTLAVTVPYDRRIITALRRVPGRRWIQEDRIWLVPGTQRHSAHLLEELWATGLFRAPESPEYPHGKTHRPGPSPGSSGQENDKELLCQCRDAIQARHYSPRTEESYLQWVQRFLAFRDKSPPGQSRPLGGECLSHPPGCSEKGKRLYPKPGSVGPALLLSPRS
ncbi:phage integrase N-terminal SAM-like domain-containing protein [Alkalispirochaeta americana]|uniref:phage integrase N-terminal SAM-like domain-containing protein n=1 Tax=Alkalispirochaeta americana TaxID=159291 RepID=UPI00117AA35D|nr:phage integrase N-terminal SAM-like domain-containing protein [Alkalispirochaeta americana]